MVEGLLGFSVYTVKKGDTLSKICRDHNTTVGVVMAFNSNWIKDKNKI